MVDEVRLWPRVILQFHEVTAWCNLVKAAMRIVFERLQPSDENDLSRIDSQSLNVQKSLHGFSERQANLQ